MRLAFIDLLFSWPPHGGADVDLYHVLDELQAAGHEVQLFTIRYAGSWERGIFEPHELPFHTSRLDFTPANFNPRDLPARIRRAVDAWRPEAVFVCDGFFMKPYVINALNQYPIAARYYAHELACHRDILRFKDGAPCPNQYLETPEACRRCALQHLAPDIKRRYHLAWLQEYLAARAFAPEYYDAVRGAMRSLSAVIVYNDLMKAAFEAHCSDVFVVPGGVDPAAFPFRPLDSSPDAAPAGRARILMTGRAEDPAKGLAVLREAGERLDRERDDFEVLVTIPEDAAGSDWFKPIGWHTHSETKALYQRADICVVPSVWDEPFGMVTLEAMATGRPVCASRVGGLQHIVVEGETGFLFDRGDAAQLAHRLATLLDSPALRKRFGEAARRRVETEYLWQHIVRKYYMPILDRLSSVGKR